MIRMIGSVLEARTWTQPVFDLSRITALVGKNEDNLAVDGLIPFRPLPDDAVGIHELGALRCVAVSARFCRGTG